MANNIYTSITRNPSTINRWNRSAIIPEKTLFLGGGGLWNGGNSGFIPFDSDAAAKDVELIRGIQFDPNKAANALLQPIQQSLTQKIAMDGYNPGTMKQQIDSLTTPSNNSGSTKSISIKPTTMQAFGMASNFLDAIPTGDKRGMWDTLDPVYHLAGGRESGAGNVMSDAGVSLTKAGLLSGLPYMALAGAALKVIGGLTNAAFGIKEDKVKKAIADLSIKTNSNFVSNANSFDDIKGPASMTATDIYEGGWFSGGKADRKNKELAGQMASAYSWADRSMLNNVYNLSHDQIEDSMRNYSALGGPLNTYLEGVDPSTAIGYSIYTDKYMKDKLKANSEMTNMFAGTPDIFGFGGGIYTKGANFDTGVSFINTGGTHEENPNDGVPMGVDSLGVPNLVEEGEVRWGDYMFSDRLTVPRGKRGNYGKRVRKYAEGGKLVKGKGIDTPYESKVLKPYEGLTFADAAKKILKRNGADERDDAITMRGIDAELSVLAGILEKEREKEKLREMQETIDNMSPEEFAMLLQQMEAQLAALQQQEMAMQLQLMIPQGMELIQPVEEQQPIAALGGLLATEDKQFKYGGNLEKFTNELRSYGLTLDDYLAYYRSANSIAEDKNLTLTDDNFNKDTAEQYLKKVIKAQKEVARKYRQEGLNPKDLTGASLEAYQRDVTAAARGASVSDDNLVINDFSSNNKGDAKATDFNRYAYTRTTRQNLIEGGATELKPNAQGTFDINYGIENPTGLTYVEGMPKWNASSQQWEDANGSKIDNPFGEGTKFSDVRGGGYNSQFENQEALSNYYKEQIAKRFQALKGENYNADRLPKYYLSKDELNNWITDLEGSSDAKDKELATMLRANWNLGADDLVESDAYLGLPATLNNELQRDAKPGVEHIPYLDAVPYSGVRYREVDTNGNPTNNYVNWDPANPVAGFSVIEQPLSTEGGVTTYGVRRNDLATNVGVLPDGTYVSMTPEQAALYTNNKVADSSALPQFTAPLAGYNHNATYYDLSKDAAGNSLGQVITTEDDSFPKPSNWPYEVAAGLQLGSLGYNILNPADYSNADALLNASKDAGLYKPVEFRPIGNYLPYKPLDIWYELNRLNANARATDRAILNNGVNQGSKAAALLASGYNNQLASGNLFRQALEYNDALRKQVTDFNRGTDMFNSEGFLKADMANQDAASRAAGYSLEGKRAAYAMRQAIDDAKANAISAGILGLGNLAMAYGLNKWNLDVLGWKLRHNQYPISLLEGYKYDPYTGKPVTASKGGKLKRRHKGLGF